MARRRLFIAGDAVELLTTRDGLAVIDAKARYWSKIAIFAGDPVGILPRRLVWKM